MATYAKRHPDAVLWLKKHSGRIDGYFISSGQYFYAEKEGVYCLFQCLVDLLKDIYGKLMSDMPVIPIITLNPFWNRRSKIGVKYGRVSARTNHPIASVNGKPTAKIFSCGAARDNMPSVRLVINNAAKTGRDNCRPDRKISFPQFARAPKIGADMPVVLMGKV